MRSAPEGLYEELGRLVEHWRDKKGVTQEALANALHLTRASISNIERGRQQVYLHTLYLLAEALGVSIEKLLPPPSLLASDRLRAHLEKEQVDADSLERILSLLKEPHEQ